MEKNLKNRINKFAERFNYNVVYQNEDLVLTNHKQVIRIREEKKSKNLLNISMNENEKAIVLPEEFIFEILYKIFHRTFEFDIELNPGKVLNIQDFCEIEYLSKDWLEKAREKKLSGGNRILFEFYYDYLILVDDLNYFKTNIMKME